MSDVGIYALVHRSAGVIYLGSSRTLAARLRRWRVRLSCVEVEVWPEDVSRRFYEASKGLLASDWELLVLQRFGADVDRAVMSAAEYRYLGCIERLWPRSVLNVIASVERAGERERERLGGVPYVKGFRPRPYDGRGHRSRFR